MHVFGSLEKYGIDARMCCLNTNPSEGSTQQVVKNFPSLDGSLSHSCLCSYCNPLFSHLSAYSLSIEQLFLVEGLPSACISSGFRGDLTIPTVVVIVIVINSQIVRQI